MKKHVFVTIAFCFVFSLQLLSFYVPLVQATLQTLHVDGTYVRDEVGNIVTLRGVCWSTSDWQYDTRNLLSEVQFQYMASWNANVVRTPINLRKIQTDATYQEYFDNFVDYAENNGLYVILGDWWGSGAGGSSPPEGWSAWLDGWGYVANHYSTRDHILYNLVNEPRLGGTSISAFIGRMEQATDRIRTHDPDAIIVMDAISHNDYQPPGQSGWWTFLWLPEHELNRSNVVYSFHHYMGQSWQDTLDEINYRLDIAGIFDATNNGYCVIVGEANTASAEWSSSEPYEPSSRGVKALNYTLHIYDDWEWGYLGWAWSRYEYPPLLDDWHGNPNDVGEIFIEHFSREYAGVEWVTWQDGFEEGNFSAWNGTPTNNGMATIVSNPAKDGLYSAKLNTTSPDDSSWARIMKVFASSSEIYMRSWVYFETLPDTRTTLYVLRMANSADNYIGVAGVENENDQYRWRISILGIANYTADSISSSTWYCLEFYINATTNGNATLWVNKVKKCELTGDFSEQGNIERVYPQVFISGAGTNNKTVYHDNFRVCPRGGDKKESGEDQQRMHASGIEVTADPNMVSKDGGTSQITVQLKNVYNQPVAQSGVEITVEVTYWIGPSGKEPTLSYRDQTGYSVIATTDSNGQAIIALTTRGPWGTAIITAHARAAIGLSSGDTAVRVMDLT